MSSVIIQGNSSGSGSVTIEAPNTNSDYTVILPAASGILGAGDVVGPASSTDNAVARFDGTTGELIQNSAVIINDSNAVSGITQLDVDNIRIDANTISSTNSNGNIILSPDGTGTIQVSGTSSASAEVQLFEDTDNGTNYVALKSPASIASNLTLTLPSADGTSGQALTTNGSGVLSFATTGMVDVGALATTSGTEVDFTGLPSGIKRILLIFYQVSTNSTSNYQIQLGTSGGFVTSGYTGFVIRQTTGASNAYTSNSSGFQINATIAAANLYSGHVLLTLESGNLWVATGIVGSTSVSAQTNLIMGDVDISGTLTQIRLTTVAGTNTFDNGSYNLFYEK